MMINIRIDGRDYQVQEGSTILEAAKQAGIIIPTICYLDGISEEAACSVCVVEVIGAKTLLRACVTKVTAGMEIFTNTERVRKARSLNLELLLASHPKDCFVCDRNQTCELRRIAFDMGIREVRFAKTTKLEMEIDSSSPSIIRDPNKCILCRRCIAVC
ncbi:MAG TPA: 2Fe-2S iron-sulfur cluster-binding protein, partial [Candidatus Omnitrophota bacterium]|nr:2Fe-2S iron-sulfur cluster-binding protein [Candidatus Omnitrophota bacterium]